VNYDLRGKAALVTGAARGLGYAISKRLLEAGANVALLGPDRETVTRAATALVRDGAEAVPLITDVSREEQVQAAFQEVARRWGRLDVLVNNAGIAGPTAPVSEIRSEDWERTLAVNLTGPFLCAREAARMMVPARSGKIINISSIAGRTAYALRAPYASSKWGLHGLTLTLAHELGPHNIQVNAICPGPVEGERMDRVIQTRAQATGLPEEEIRKQFTDQTVLGRFVSPRDVAELVLYLASPAGDGITAEILSVTGGWRATLH